MVDDMDLVLKQEVDGYIVVNGQADQKDDMEFDRVQLQRPNTRVHGLVVCRTDTVQKPMLMAVSKNIFLFFFLNIKLISF